MERLGFEEVVRVPDSGQIAFILLQQEGVELMIQTTASVLKDEPKFAPQNGAPVAYLFIEVKDLRDISDRLRDYPIAMAERTTFYGMREIGVFEPSGSVVIFACKV